MYPMGGGGPFAELYFGTKAEADKEGKLDLKSAVYFGPVIERVVNLESLLGTNSTFFAIDFDSGRLVTLAPDVDISPFANGHDYLEAKGADAMSLLTISNRNASGLLCINGTFAMRVDATNWDNTSADRVKTIAAKLPLDTSLNKVQMESVTVMLISEDGIFPKTFLFKTGAGGTGILQINGFTGDPRGIKIRYKLVEDGRPQITLPTKTIVLTRATNQLVGTTSDTRTVDVWSDTIFFPGEKIHALVKRADGQITDAQSLLFTMWSQGKVGTSTSFSWFFKDEDGFGAIEAEAATTQIREHLTKRPLVLKAFAPVKVFCVTNQEGGTLTGYIEFDQAEPAPPEASGKIKATVRIQRFGSPYIPSIGFLADVPSGYALRATASEGQAQTTTPGGPYDYNSSWFRTFHPGRAYDSGALNWNVKIQTQPAAGQPMNSMDQSEPFEVVLGEPRLIFSVTNAPGDVYQGFLELVGPHTVEK